MKVIDSFRPVNKRVGVAMVTFGALLGLGIALASWHAIAMVATALILGAAASIGIFVAYQTKFPDGIPKSSTSDIISPQYYGKVAKRHFTNFVKALFVPIALGFVAHLCRLPI